MFMCARVFARMFRIKAALLPLDSRFLSPLLPYASSLGLFA